MAVKKVYVGPFGPFLYDDADLINDPDGDFPGETRQAFLTDGQVKPTEAPTESDDTIRLGDLGIFSPVKLNARMFFYSSFI